jgi:hypothetical protein
MRGRNPAPRYGLMVTVHSPSQRRGLGKGKSLTPHPFPPPNLPLGEEGSERLRLMHWENAYGSQTIA